MKQPKQQPTKQQPKTTRVLLEPLPLAPRQRAVEAYYDLLAQKLQAAPAGASLPERFEAMGFVPQPDDPDRLVLTMKLHPCHTVVLTANTNPPLVDKTFSIHLHYHFAPLANEADPDMLPFFQWVQEQTEQFFEAQFYPGP